LIIHLHVDLSPVDDYHWIMGKAYAISAGDTFGRFTVIREADPITFPSGSKRQFLCRCECGTKQPVTAQSLVNGRSASCGCLKNELASKRATKHGHSKGGVRSPEHSAWHSILQRCHNQKNKRFSEWGGHGIKVCDRWQGESGFANFLADMGKRPSKRHSIDRFPDNNGDYQPGNCRWATMKEQCNNKRNNHLVTFRGKTQTMTQWSEETGISYAALRDRIVCQQWPIERALTEPVMSLQQRIRERRDTVATGRPRRPL
jgi:hypothetical protein